MQYSIGDTVTLRLDYPLAAVNVTIIPAGTSGIVSQVIAIGDAYLVDFSDDILNLLVPESWLE